MMKNIAFFLMFGLLLSSCRPRIFSDNPSAIKLERYVRHYQDKRATHTWEQYKELLAILDDERFVKLPIHEFKDSLNSNKVLIALRHDVDCHPYKAYEMAELEKAHNIRASYYILSTADYYGKFHDTAVNRYPCMDSIYMQIHSMGHEIGIHNDLTTVMITRKLEPFLFTKNEVAYFNDLGIPIYGSVAHGSYVASNSVRNFEIFSDYAESDSITYGGNIYPIGEYSMAEFGFTYEANFVPYNKYYSESGGKWGTDGGFEKVLEQIKASKPGDRIQILTHPVWWGKNN